MPLTAALPFPETRDELAAVGLSQQGPAQTYGPASGRCGAVFTSHHVSQEALTRLLIIATMIVGMAGAMAVWNLICS